MGEQRLEGVALEYIAGDGLNEPRQNGLADEEGHIDWLETELDLIGKIGLQNYLQSQIKVKD